MRRKSIIYIAAVAALLTGVLAGCASTTNTENNVNNANSTNTAGSGQESADNKSSDKPRVLEIRFDQAANPMSYVDENGVATGFDVEILRLVDEKLPEYEFHFEGTSKDDVIAGLTSGTYDIGLHNAFYTEDRASKFYIPEENIAGSVALLVFRAGEETQFAGLEGEDLLEAIYDAGYKFCPLISGDGRTFQIEQYNQNHPDKQIEIEYTSNFDISNEYYEWVIAGKYDVALFIESGWNKTVIPEDGANHKYLDKLGAVKYKAIKSYPMISKITLSQEFADQVSDAIKELKDDGTAAKLAEEFYGKNIFEEYPFEQGW